MCDGPPLVVTFLGTRDGSRRPGANTSAQLVAAGETCVLVDAGFGAARQLRVGGLAVESIDGVLLSHWHPDHVAGLPRLIGGRARAGAPRLAVHGPAPPRSLARLVRALVHFVPAAAGDEVEIGALRCVAFATDHGPPSLGWSLADAHGRRVAIPADTRPRPAVVQAVTGADVLVYEATFASDHERARADRTGHSTAAEAGRLAAQAGVGALVLTHLSLRYERDVLRAEAAAAHGQVIVPRDLDRLEIEPTALADRHVSGWGRVRLIRARS